MKKNILNPSPISKIECACGCGNEFQPSRSNQRFINSKHADFAYNMGPRKEKYSEENATTKIIRKNDRILEKYFKICNKIGDKIYLPMLKSEGFHADVFTRVIGFNKNGIEIKFHALYKYCYRIIIQGEINYIEIQKL